MAMLVIIRGYHTWVMDEVMDATLKPIEEAGMPLEMCKRAGMFQKMVPENGSRTCSIMFCPKSIWNGESIPSGESGDHAWLENPKHVGFHKKILYKLVDFPSSRVIFLKQIHGMVKWDQQKLTGFVFCFSG